ncbi:hypothetical protein AB4Y77_17390 [Paenarthrobacter sp. YAF11_1]|uniref:hypothetical protein n=1 Tax=Paenarthrobacter sp. YAF11_1 TaxID=3233074 RepID=UPI003F9A2851
MAAATAAPAAPAVAAAVAADSEASGWLELDAGPAGQVHRLTPGGSADWAVDVHVRGEPATSLEVGLKSEPAATDVLRDFLSVELQSCSEPWSGSSCADGHRVLMHPTSLNSAGGVRVDLMGPDNTELANAHVLLTATLAEDVPREVQGSRTQIVVGVHGSGDEDGNGSGNGAGAGGGAGSGGNAGSGGSAGNPAGPSSGVLTETGFRMGGFALLGVVAVAAGFGLARLRGGVQ